MRFRRHRGHKKESQHTHRWLVSYADYMTIMFAFFVVMYAIAINNKDEQFAVFSQTLEQIFDKATNVTADAGNNVSTDGLLPQPLPPTDELLHGQSVQPESPQSSKILPEHTDVSLVAQQQLGDVVFVEVPEVGADLGKGDELAVVESVKAASEVYAPITGEVVDVNADLEGEPSLVNEDALGKGWFAKIKISDSAQLEELMDEDAYKSFIEGL